MGKRKSYFSTLKKMNPAFSFSKPLDILFLLYTSRLKAIFQEGIFNVQSALNWTFQSFYPPHTKNYENKISWQFFPWRTWKLSWWPEKKILFFFLIKENRILFDRYIVDIPNEFWNMKKFEVSGFRRQYLLAPLTLHVFHYIFLHDTEKYL